MALRCALKTEESLLLVRFALTANAPARAMLGANTLPTSEFDTADGSCASLDYWSCAVGEVAARGTCCYTTVLIKSFI